MSDWITCPTCNGHGVIFRRGNQEDACPDCVDGLIPSPELVERVTEAGWTHDANGDLDFDVKAALLASRQSSLRNEEGDTHAS